jgi:hypothetical protein
MTYLAQTQRYYQFNIIITDDAATRLADVLRPFVYLASVLASFWQVIEIAICIVTDFCQAANFAVKIFSIIVKSLAYGLT